MSVSGIVTSHIIDSSTDSACLSAASEVPSSHYAPMIFPTKSAGENGHKGMFPPIAREIINTPCLDITRFTVALQKWYLGAQPLDSLRARGIEYLVFSERYTSGWVHGERVAGKYRTFMPHVIKTFETKWRPRLNDFHSPKIYVAKTSGR